MVLALPDGNFRRFWNTIRNFRFFKKNIKVCLMHTKVGCYRRKLCFTASGVSQRSLPTPHDLGILSSNPGFGSHVTAQTPSDRIFRRFWNMTRNFRFFKKNIKMCLMHHKVRCYRQESSFNTSGRFCGCPSAYRDLAAGSSFWASHSEYSGF